MQSKRRMMIETPRKLLDEGKNEWNNEGHHERNNELTKQIKEFKKEAMNDRKEDRNQDVKKNMNTALLCELCEALSVREPQSSGGSCGKTQKSRSVLEGFLAASPGSGGVSWLHRRGLEGECMGGYMWGLGG